MGVENAEKRLCSTPKISMVREKGMVALFDKAY